MRESGAVFPDPPPYDTGASWLSNPKPKTLKPRGGVWDGSPRTYTWLSHAASGRAALPAAGLRV